MIERPVSTDRRKARCLRSRAMTVAVPLFSIDQANRALVYVSRVVSDIVEA